MANTDISVEDFLVTWRLTDWGLFIALYMQSAVCKVVIAFLSVCLSVCLSHSGILSKRLEVSSKSFDRQ